MSDSFANTDDFFKESGVERIVPFKLGRRYYSLLNTTGWAIVVLVPMLKFLIGLLLSGELLYFSIAFAILSACKLTSNFYHSKKYFNSIICFYYSLCFTSTCDWNVKNK